jgi:hypothetical protein
MSVDISNMISENVILIDAEYADNVAFDLSVNFERMLERRIPKADLAHWLDCIALDGGIEPGANDLLVVFIHEKKNKSLDNFSPSNFESELNGKAFKDNLGEFSIESYPVAEDVTNKEEFFLEALKVIADNEKVKRIMLVPDIVTYGTKVKDAIRSNKDKDITLFAMEPQQGRGFNQQILGYSLMSALGIRGEEIR